MALTACCTVSWPAAASGMWVGTAALNCTYQDGAPFGNGACACAPRIADSCEAWPMLPALTSSWKLDSRAGSGNVLTTSLEPLSPAQVAWFSVLVNHLMNSTAPATFLAVLGMPMPSGLATAKPGPAAPGVETYSVWFTTLEDAGTL